ncbi:MAG: mechanosensitive ion channel [Methanomassiliicoccales archaeon]|nr:mechanosensitive ion channel [Methanomassiliicoccales archaeon]
MWKRAVNLSLLVAGALLLLIIDHSYPDQYLQRGALTMAVLAGFYLVFTIFLTIIFSTRVAEAKTRYQLRKVLSVLNLIFSLGAIVTIWVTDPQALVVSYGILAAGVAIALQDLFRNITGGFIIFVQSPYRVGDRVRIKEVVGDVIDLSLMYTTLLELQEWVDGDQATGRLVMVPNGYILSGNVHNYTKDNNFLWDELVVPVSYESDWRRLVGTVQGLVERETEEVTTQARSELSSMMGKYYLTEREVQPRIYLALTSNYLELHVRFICLTRQRRELRSRLSRLILEEMEREGASVGSTTIEIIKFPGVGGQGTTGASEGRM